MQAEAAAATTTAGREKWVKGLECRCFIHPGAIIRIQDINQVIPVRVLQLRLDADRNHTFLFLTETVYQAIEQQV